LPLGLDDALTFSVQTFLFLAAFGFGSLLLLLATLDFGNLLLFEFFAFDGQLLRLGETKPIALAVLLFETFQFAQALLFFLGLQFFLLPLLGLKRKALMLGQLALLFLLPAFFGKALGLGNPLALAIEPFLFLAALGFDGLLFFLAASGFRRLLFFELLALGGQALRRGDANLLLLDALLFEALLFFQLTLILLLPLLGRQQTRQAHLGDFGEAAIGKGLQVAHPVVDLL
jgi:hypothetical protein